MSVGVSESTQTGTLFYTDIPTVESHQQNPDLPEAGGPLGHGRQLPAGAAHAAATAMATLGEQGANSLAWETHPEQTLKACVLSCFVQCSR